MNDDYEPLVGHFEPIKHGGRDRKIREIEAMGLGLLNVFSQFSTGHQSVCVCVCVCMERTETVATAA